METNVKTHLRRADDVRYETRVASFGINVGEHAAALEKLGKYKAGMGCLYINKLADIDLKVLKGMIRSGVEAEVKYFSHFHRHPRSAQYRRACEKQIPISATADHPNPTRSTP